MPQKMSIRLWSDGHSFPREQISTGGETREVAMKEKGAAAKQTAAGAAGTMKPDAAENPLIVELLSPRTTLVPETRFRPEQAESYLLLTGQACHDSESVVWSEPCGGMVAVMAIDSATRMLLPDEVRFTSPLLTLEVAAQSVLLARYEKLLYIKVRDEELRLAEVIRIESEEDLVYYLTRLGEVIPLRNYSLCVAGDNPQKWRKTVKKLFK